MLRSVTAHLYFAALREGAAGSLPEGQRFRWLVAPRSTVVQRGAAHTGLTDDLDGEAARLLARLVLSPAG